MRFARAGARRLRGVGARTGAIVALYMLSRAAMGGIRAVDAEPVRASCHRGAGRRRRHAADGQPMALAARRGAEGARHLARRPAAGARRRARAGAGRAARPTGEPHLPDRARACGRVARVRRRFDAGQQRGAAQRRTRRPAPGDAGRRPARPCGRFGPAACDGSPRRQRRGRRRVRHPGAGLGAPHLVEPGLAKCAAPEQQCAGARWRRLPARGRHAVGIAVAVLARAVERGILPGAHRRPGAGPGQRRTGLRLAPDCPTVLARRDRAHPHGAIRRRRASGDAGQLRASGGGRSRQCADRGGAKHDSGNGIAGYDLRVRCPAGLRCAVYGQAEGEDDRKHLPFKYLELLGSEVWSPDGTFRFYFEAAEIGCRQTWTGPTVAGCAYRNYAYPGAATPTAIAGWARAPAPTHGC